MHRINAMHQKVLSRVINSAEVVTKKDQGVNYKELFEKYQALCVENNNLKEELRSLKERLGIVECQGVSLCEGFDAETDPEMLCLQTI